MEATKRAPTPMMNCKEFLEIRTFVVKEENIFPSYLIGMSLRNLTKKIAPDLTDTISDALLLNFGIFL